jgi:hypothetical protein
MEIAEIEAKLKVYKATGHTSRIDLPFVVVERLIAAAKAWEQAPQIVKDAAIAAGAK